MANSGASGFTQMQRELKALDKGLVSAMQKEAKAIAKPGADKVKSVIPSVAPLSGMNNRGRLGWNVGKRANNVTVNYSTRRSKIAATTSLVSIRVNSPVAAMIDVSGKGRGTRSANGDSMVNVLKSRGVTNFAWPAVEQEIPSMAAEIRLVLDKYADMVSRRLS
jgi:hypothetical protein